MVTVVNVNNFRLSLQFTLKWEGGYVNDPADPGGETKWGISKRAYPNLDIRNLSADQASDIYASDYWLKAGCDSLPLPYCTVVFDSAVNDGVSTATYWLKQAENIRQYLNLRRMRYYALVQKNAAMNKYLTGWLNRLNDLTKFVDVQLNAPVVPEPNQDTPKWGSLG